MGSFEAIFVGSWVAIAVVLVVVGIVLDTLEGRRPKWRGSKRWTARDSRSVYLQARCRELYRLDPDEQQ